MTKSVREWVIDEASAGEHELNARRLFICFSALARKSYRYSASRVKGNEAETLLDRPKDEIVIVDCMSLAGALAELLNESLEDEGAQVVSQGHGAGFATQAKSRCFDTSVVGNIRKPGENWAATGRCIFMMHYFVETGAATRMYFDPCMFTTYSTKSEVISWKLFDGGGPFYHKIKRVEGNPGILLVRVPEGHPAPPPDGFTGGWVQFRTNQLSKDELRALGGRRESGWDGTKYDDKAAAAMARLNKLLKEQANINTPLAL